MRKNVILITADQFRFDAMGHVGAFPVKTPNLDALAAGGTSFEAYTPYPMCGPARASIMTGLPACKHEVYYNSMPWAKNLETLPGVLSENGFYTVLVGKTHFFPPMRHGGFDKLILTSDRRKAIGVPETKKVREPGEIGRTWDKMVVNHYSQTWKEGGDPEKHPGVSLTTCASEELERLTKERACTGAGTEQFFMWLSLLQPHSPCKPPPPYSDMYRPEDIPPPVKTQEEIASFSKPLLSEMRGWHAVDDELIQNFRARYFGDVSLVDAQVGRVIQKLDELGLRENTIVIFCSDHGDYLGDHHLMQKGKFHEPSSRVPLIFNGPEVAVGHKVRGLASLCDLKPTILDACGLMMPPLQDSNGEFLYPEWTASPPDNMSLVGALQGGNVPEDRVMTSECGTSGHGLMARKGNLKYNYYPQSNEFDLFDLEADPNELHNRGKEVSWESLPDWARDAFDRIMADCERFRHRSYEYDGKIYPMFT